jgi:hypothetical protein
MKQMNMRKMMLGGSIAAAVLEACQRTQARFAKFLATGTPEQFGSEEPFTFDPKKKCP